VLESKQSENMFSMIHADLQRMTQRNWPDRQDIANLADLVVDGSRQVLFP